MRRLVVGLAILAVTLASCSDDALPEPVEVETCDELVDVSVQLLDAWVEVIEELPVDQLLAEDPPPEFDQLAQIGDDLDARAARLGCDAEEINVEVRARMATDSSQDPESPVGEMLLDLVRGGVVGELPPAPPTTEG